MSTKQLEKFSTEVDIPENVKVSIKSHMLNVEGPLGKTYKNFFESKHADSKYVGRPRALTCFASSLTASC